MLRILHTCNPCSPLILSRTTHYKALTGFDSGLLVEYEKTYTFWLAKQTFLANQKVYIFSYSTNWPESNPAFDKHFNYDTKLVRVNLNLYLYINYRTLEYCHWFWYFEIDNITINYPCNPRQHFKQLSSFVAWMW